MSMENGVVTKWKGWLQGQRGVFKEGRSDYKEEKCICKLGRVVKWMRGWLQERMGCLQ